MNLMLNIGVGEGESDHVWIVSCPEPQGPPAPSSGERQASSQSHGEGRGRRLQLLVQQAEQHGAPVTLGGLTQRAMQLGLQVVDIPQTLLTVQSREVGGGLLQRVHGLFHHVCRRNTASAFNDLSITFHWVII